jgi:hypothetical protein
MSFQDTLSADGSTTFYRAAKDGECIIEGEGTWGSGTLTPKIKSYDGTAITYGTSTLTADGAIAVVLKQGQMVGAALTGSTTPSLKVHFRMP